MTTWRIQKPKVIVEEEKKIPTEVANIRDTISSNGWKLLIDRINNTIEHTRDIVMSPKPLWMSEKKEHTYYSDLEALKIKAECYEELKKLPELICSEFGESEFEVDNSDKV